MRPARLALLLGLALVALHLDFWRPPREARIWFGWIPGELLWRLVWMGLAFLYLAWFCARVSDVDASDDEDSTGAAAP